MRFDEIELEAVPDVIDEPPPPRAAERSPRFRMLLALLTDLSLFAALTLALSPLLSSPATSAAIASLGGFVLMVSYYYFVGSWMLWGKTIGGAIFDARVASEPLTLREASARWTWVVLSVVIGAAAFFAARIVLTT